MQSSAALFPMICALNIAQGPTVDRTISPMLRLDPLIAGPTPYGGTSYGATFGASVAAIVATQVDRATTENERIAGELRRWRVLPENWDGEGALAPNARSIAEAVAFVCLIPSTNLPEPMLHSTGRAGLFWKGEGLYADLEFLGDGQVAYYIERNQGKHKGVVLLDKTKMPSVLETLISV